MATLNKVMLIGRLTDNPEAPRTLPNSGSTVIRFRFAVGRSRKNPQTGQWENDPNPLYIDCEAFTRPPAERPTAGPGRPRKQSAAAPAPKRPRGRPRKGG